MNPNLARLVLLTFALAGLPLPAAAAGLAPGLYEYTTKMSMPGMPNMPAQVVKRCLTAEDTETKSFGAPPKDSDCQIKDMTETGAEFSYNISCTKPEKMDGKVKGTFTSTGMTMDMTMSMPNANGTMTQSTTAKRVGDCK